MEKKFFKDKYPSEEYYDVFDYTDSLEDGEGIASAVISVIDMSDSSVVTDTFTDVAYQAIEDGLVYVWHRAGSSGHNYATTCVAKSSVHPEKTMKQIGYKQVL